MKTIIDVELSLRWEDFVFKARRVEKRLKKAFVSMASELEDDLLHERASPLEVLVACGVAVWQGYWHSAASDTEKKRALDVFAKFLFTIVFNECYLRSNLFQGATGQHGNLDAITATAEERFRPLFVTRTTEYTGGALEFMNRGGFPLTLARTLSHNLLLPDKEPADGDQRDIWEATVMAVVAVPFMATFSCGMRQFR